MIESINVAMAGTVRVARHDVTSSFTPSLSPLENELLSTGKSYILFYEKLSKVTHCTNIPRTIVSLFKFVGMLNSILANFKVVI